MQCTQAFDKISKQACSLSKQIVHLLSVNGMQQPVDSQMAANHGMPTASSSILQARAAKSPRLKLEAQVGLSSGLSSVQEAVDEWFTGDSQMIQRHSLSLAELQDAVRLSSPMRHPNATDSKPAQSQYVNRSPGITLLSISQFAAWVQQATGDIARRLSADSSSSWSC